MKSILTRKDLDHINYPLIKIETNGLLIETLMIPISTRGIYRNYISGQGQTINLQEYLISKTNGINVNLVSLETQKNDPLIKKTPLEQWPKKLNRKYLHLTPTYSLKETNVKCTLEVLENEKIEIVEFFYDLRRVEEKCFYEKIFFKNKHWVDSGGEIWKSMQWISPNNIYMTLTVLKK